MIALIVAGFIGDFLTSFFIIAIVLWIVCTVLLIRQKKSNKKAQEEYDKEGPWVEYDRENRILTVIKRKDTGLLKIIPERHVGIEKTPEILHVGAASTGGVTVGGSYVTGGENVITGGEKTGRYQFEHVVYKDLIDKIILTPELYEEAKRSSIASYVSADRTLPTITTKERCEQILNWIYRKTD